MAPKKGIYTSTSIIHMVGFMVWLKVVTDIRFNAFGLTKEEGYIDLSKVEEVRVKKGMEKGFRIIFLLGKGGKELGILKVPRNKADEIAHRIIKLINRSKEGKLKDEMMICKDGVLLRYNPDKDLWSHKKNGGMS